MKTLVIIQRESISTLSKKTKVSADYTWIINSFDPSVSFWIFGIVLSAKLDSIFCKNIWRNIAQMVNMNNFSSICFQSTP
jgi:hypothetical protein